MSELDVETVTDTFLLARRLLTTLTRPPNNMVKTNQSAIHQVVSATAHALSPPHLMTKAGHNAQLRARVSHGVAGGQTSRVPDDEENERLNPLVAILLIYGILVRISMRHATLPHASTSMSP